MFVIGAVVAAILGAAMARNLRLGAGETIRSLPPHLVYTGQSYLRPLYTEPPGFRAARRREAKLAPPAPQVLADDRHDDQAESGQPQQEHPLQILARETVEDRQDLAGGEQGEGNGEGEEQ
jgi:hypothetical protein